MLSLSVSGDVCVCVLSLSVSGDVCVCVLSLSVSGDVCECAVFLCVCTPCVSVLSHSVSVLRV